MKRTAATALMVMALVGSSAGSASAAPLAKCANDPENFQLVLVDGEQVCLSDGQVEKLTNKGQLPR